MADEKKKGAALLYDNERSMKREPPKERDREAAATAEADMERGDKPRADAEKPSKSEEKELKAVESHSKKFLDAIGKIRKRHESERRDYHGTHREALRAMAQRHDKEIGELLDSLGIENAENQVEAEVMAEPSGMEA